MLYYSTNKKSPSVSFQQALLQGMAADGGLYFPEKFPTFSSEDLEHLQELSLSEIAYVFLTKWFGDEFDKADLKKVARHAFDFPLQIKRVGGIFVLELFHSPTMAFKDIGARVMAQLFSMVLTKKQQTATILVATSGDTGSAIAQGFADIPQVKLVILYPKGKVSELQEEQVTRVADNVVPIEVMGSFDDCQALVKKAFVDWELESLHLTSANSINIGRLLPQAISYLYAYATLQKDNLVFVVPSGNLGNVTAGLFAWKMGMPCKCFVIASNTNDALSSYERTGIFTAKKSVQTLSNAMDIGSPNNFVRILELFNRDHNRFIKMIKVFSIDDPLTIATIKKVYKEYDYLLDPHTAVGFAAAEKLGDSDSERVVLSTASPKKFAKEITDATGIAVDNTEEFAKLQKRPKKKIALNNTYEALKEVLFYEK